jgi:hypothetical protein
MFHEKRKTSVQNRNDQLAHLTRSYEAAQNAAALQASARTIQTSDEGGQASGDEGSGEGSTN